MISKLEKKIISLIQDDIPIIKRPYYELSKKINISEERFINILKDLTHRGIIRRFGATLRHQRSGYKANVMTAWQINEPEIKKKGTIIASFKEVSHCYQRNCVHEWPYNLYSMIHGRSKEECFKTVKQISKKINTNTYIMLFSIKELKKTSMLYFNAN